MAKFSNIQTNHTLSEYKRKYEESYEAGDLWDFSIEDVQSGAVELETDRIYWQINDRIYETEEYVEQ